MSDELLRHEDLLLELRAAAAIADPAPAEYLDFARQALALTRMDAELGRMLEEDLVGARSTSVGFAAAFEFSTTMLDVELIDGRLVGRVDPGREMAIEVQTVDATHRLRTDDDGWFHLADAPQGRFRVILGDDRSLVTEWMNP